MGIMAKMEDLLKHCRYYNGAEHCPDDVHPMFWAIERHWVKAKTTSPEPKDSDCCIMKDYIDAGLENFEKDDDVSIVIKVLIYEWYQKIAGFNRENAIKGFPKFYAYYKNGGTKQAIP